MEQATYQINGTTYTQTFLTPGRYARFMQLIRSVEFEGVDPLNVISALDSAGKLQEGIDIVFEGQPKLPADSIKPAVLTRMVLDFFDLNDVSEILQAAADKAPAVLAKVKNTAKSLRTSQLTQ